jgi:hypothetical protein
MPAYKRAVRFGANDHPKCSECKDLMRLTRRAPHPIHGIEFEQQTFECWSCGRVKTKLGGATAWTERNKKDGEFMAVKKPAKKKNAAKKFKGVRREKAA